MTPVGNARPHPAPPTDGTPRPVAATVRVLALVLACVASACSHRSDERPLETASIAHGPFEIVAKGRRISTGTFPNTGGNPFATMEVTGFTVRHQGQPVSITHGSRTLAGFWRVVRLTDAPVPALLVQVAQVAHRGE